MTAVNSSNAPAPVAKITTGDRSGIDPAVFELEIECESEEQDVTRTLCKLRLEFLLCTLRASAALDTSQRARTRLLFGPFRSGPRAINLFTPSDGDPEPFLHFSRTPKSSTSVSRSDLERQTAGVITMLQVAH